MSKCKECGQDTPEVIVRDMYDQPIDFDDMVVWLRPRASLNTDKKLEMMITLQPVLMVQAHREFNINTGKGCMEFRHYFSDGTTHFDFEVNQSLPALICLNKAMGAMQGDGRI